MHNYCVKDHIVVQVRTTYAGLIKRKEAWMSIELYLDRVAATSRGVWLFCLEEGIEHRLEQVSLMEGEHKGEAFTALNPHQMLPVIREGDFVLTEAAAILRYLANKTGSDAYPSEPQARARVDEVIDWFNSQCYRDLGFNLIYTQLFPHHSRGSDEANEANARYGARMSRRWLGLVDGVFLREHPYLAGEQISIADYFAASVLTLADLIGFDLVRYERLGAWLGRMRQLTHWQEVHAAYDGMATSLSQGNYVTPQSKEVA
jgi:glutathione S-transferase